MNEIIIHLFVYSCPVHNDTVLRLLKAILLSFSPLVAVAKCFDEQIIVFFFVDKMQISEMSFKGTEH